jgi:CBS domain-containing protein
MNCQELMTKDPVCCIPSDTVQKAAQLMKSENIGPIPVVVDEQDKTLVGIVTDRDLALRVVAEALDARNTLVQEVMTSGAIACLAEDDLRDALYAMEQYQLRRIPVIDSNQQLIGIIAQADIATRLQSAAHTAEVVEEISKSRATRG